MHNLDFTQGFAAIALAEHTQPAWHGHGTRIRPDAPTEEWQRVAGADYTVIERPAFYTHIVSDDEALADRTGPAIIHGSYAGKRLPKTIPNRKVLLRDDTQGYLATVGHKFEIFQPTEVFDFQREVIARLEGAAVMETAGVLDEGRRLWTLSRLLRDITVGDDVLRGYIMASTAFDGTMATRFQPTTTRVVCENTLNYAMAGTRNGYVSVPHSTKVDVNSVVTQLLEGVDAMEGLERDFNHLAERKVTVVEIQAFLEAVLDNPFRTDKDGDEVVSGPAQKIIALFGRGQGQRMRSANGTAWGLLNAVTEYTDFNQRAKNPGTRFVSSQFGAGAARKDKALVTAREMFIGEAA